MIFFSKEKFNPIELYKSMNYLKNSKIIQNAENTLTCEVMVNNKPVQVSFFGDIDFVNKIKGSKVAENGIKIASVEDVFATKLATVVERASKKDYLDIYEVLKKNKCSLKKGLENAKKLYGNQFSESISLSAMVYFKDVDLPKMVEIGLKSEVKKFMDFKEKENGIEI